MQQTYEYIQATRPLNHACMDPCGSAGSTPEVTGVQSQPPPTPSGVELPVTTQCAASMRTCQADRIAG